MGNKAFVFDPKPSRIYPQQNLFSHILGQTDDMNEGISVVENYFDEDFHLMGVKSISTNSHKQGGHCAVAREIWCFVLDGMGSDTRGKLTALWYY